MSLVHTANRHVITRLTATAGGVLWLMWLAFATTRSDLPWYCVRCGEEIILGRALLYMGAAAGIGTAALSIAVEKRVRLGGGGLASALLVTAGSMLLVVGLLASLISEVWMVTFLGEVTTVIGALALAAASVAAKVLPPTSAALLAVGALGLVILNVGEDVGPLLAAPYGAAWIWIGLTVRVQDA